MKRASQVIVMIAVALSLGLHWGVLQSVAWASMFAGYSAGNKLSVAIEKTFDGDNKCEICRFVEDGTRQDETGDGSFPFKLKKLDGCFPGNSILIAAPTLISISMRPSVRWSPEIHYRPASPPPRA